MMLAKTVVMKQFSNPKGRLGKKISEYMAYKNFSLNMWSVAMLKLKSDSQVLEIGFGPGYAIERMAQIAFNGQIVGIDYSELMVKQAKKRNWEYIQSERVRIIHGNVSNLPIFENEFDSILSVNNIMYWSNHVETLRNLKSTLKPGGRMTIVLKRYVDGIKAGDSNNEMSWYASCLKQAGYIDVQIHAQPLFEEQVSESTIESINVALYGKAIDSHIPAGVCITGVKPTVFDQLALFPSETPFYWNDETYSSQ